MWAAVLAGALVIFAGAGDPANAQSIAYKQAVAAAASDDPEVLKFYQDRDFKPIWTSNADRSRRTAFLDAASKAWIHGLPTSRYDAEEIKKDFGNIRSAKARGLVEVATTKKFLQYAQDIQSGVLDPRRLAKDMALKPPRRDRVQLLDAFLKSTPSAFMRALPPQHPDYARLLKEKARLERVLGRGGWGDKVPGGKLKLGGTSNNVVALRARLMEFGFRGLGNSPEFDEGLETVVKTFQTDHGLNSDGVVGSATLAAVNTSAQTRLQQVIIGLERQRWLNKPRGARHIFVNQAAFTGYVMDNGKVTLETRVVVGKRGSKFRTPEFEDVMTHLIVNPTWHVPRSIATQEYLPMLKENPAALARQGITMIDVSGRRVDSTSLDYSQFDVKNFPFDLKQPPGRGNALGTVKFMFPNRFNVYLHDTPSKSLFGRDIRAYSHGCVRVQKPHELAYTLLGRQSSDPIGLFKNTLASKVETQIDLREPLPVYLVYHTAWVSPDGRANYRLDTYGRDKLVFNALQKAGVTLHAVRS